MVSIRPEQSTDPPRVFEIQAEAFGRRNEAELVNLLRASAQPQISLVAEESGRVVGHIFFSPVEIESAGSPRAAGLAPVAVAPDQQGRGVGAALIRAGLERCPGVGWKAVFLVGAPGYYSRFGFGLAARRGFSYGDPLFDSVLQVHELEPDALDGHGGLVRFHRSFAETGCG